MKKLFALFALLLVVTLFVGCATVSLEYQIDNGNTLLVNYEATIDKTKEQDMQINYFNITTAIKKQWELQGLSVNVDENDESIRMVGVMSKQFDSRQKAFEGLDAILKSEYSPFDSTGFEYASSYLEDEYKLFAKVALIDLIRRSETQVMPGDMQGLLTKYANESKFSISISLPGEAVDTNADSVDNDNGMTTNTWDLKYGEEKELELNSIVANQENVDFHKTMTTTTNRFLLIFLICGGGAVLVLAAFLIIFFKLKRKG